MNITSPMLAGAVRVAELPGDSVTSFLRMIGAGTGLFGDSVDGGLGLVMSALAGVSAALAVAIVLSVYFRSGYRSPRDLIKHGLAATVVLGLVAFVVYDVRHAALAYLGINPAKPAVEFEIRLPKAVLTAVADTQVELLTDRNQKLAKVRDALASTSDGRSQRAEGNRYAGLSHHRARGSAQSAGASAAPVPAAAAGGTIAFRPVRTMASGRRHRACQRQRRDQRDQRRLRDPLSQCRWYDSVPRNH
jgi:hypothetical protein